MVSFLISLSGEWLLFFGVWYYIFLHWKKNGLESVEINSYIKTCHFDDKLTRGENMNKNKIIGLVAIVIIVAVSLPALYFVESSLAPVQQPTKEMDFVVSGSSDCLRFLNSSVPAIYVPFTVAANENWQLTINCTKMSGGQNGYTDVYVYQGFWDGGSNNTCTSSELYPILKDIQSTNQQISLKSSFSETYGDSTQQSYTIFFVLPPGGQQSTFHITYKQV
jgi:hypothetical protein